MPEKDPLAQALERLAVKPESDQKSPQNEREKEFEKIESLIVDIKKQFLADEKIDLRHAVGSIAVGLSELIGTNGEKKEGKKTEGDQDKEDPLDPESKKNKEQVKKTAKEHRKGLVLVLQGGDDGTKSGE